MKSIRSSLDIFKLSFKIFQSTLICSHKVIIRYFCCNPSNSEPVILNSYGMLHWIKRIKWTNKWPILKVIIFICLKGKLNGYCFGNKEIYPFWYYNFFKPYVILSHLMKNLFFVVKLSCFSVIVDHYNLSSFVLI